jgi:hypothetical protein
MKYLFLLVALCFSFAQAADLPDHIATPGAINPNVTQANISQTVCVSGWTKTIRPPASYTNKLKKQQLADGAYKSSEPMSSFEEDHLISLEIGGNPTDPKNLWPQHWSAPWGAHQKDQLENYLKRAVCTGKMTLAQAQKEAATDWIASYKLHGLK